ncbi:MAG: tandem-95 repeat protein [Cognaticolwellia sp.]
MFSRRYICILIILTLTACGDGGESTPQQEPSAVVPQPTPIPLPSIETIDLTGQTGAALTDAMQVNGEQTKNRAAVNDSFANAVGTLRHVSSNTNVEGNLTIGVTASDNDYMTKVSLYLPNVGRVFVLCSDSCEANFQSTIAGFNPQLANEIAGPLRIELIVEDSLGNSAIVDALSVNWQPIQISAISGSRDNGVVAISWSGNSSLERYNVYAATELGLTTLNAQTLNNGTQKLAISGTSTTFSDADASKDYHLLITGIDSGGESGESSPYIIPRTIGTPNQSPVANNDSYQVNEDETVTVNVLENDFDPEGQLITVDSILLQPVNGSLDFDTAGNFTYIPNVNFNGTDSASYRLLDIEGAAAEATVLFNVLAINDDPIAVNDTYGVEPNGQISAANTNLLSNDSDIDGDDLQISTTPITAPEKGTVTINADGSFFYQSTGVLSDNDQFVYQILDGFGGTASATVTILPNGNTLPPLAQNDDYQVDEDNTLVVASVNLGILANDSDPNDLPFQLLETLLIQPQNGQLNLSLDGTFTYIPNINFVGVDQFQYQIKNSADLLAQAFVTITINSVADIPIALDDHYQAQEDEELLVAASSGLLINDVDFDNSILKVNIIPVNPPQKGDLVLAQDGSFSYMPNADFNGVDSFTYQVFNEEGLTNTANVNIVTAPINDAPIVINDSVTINEDNSVVVDVLANDSDKEGDDISLISFDIANGTAAIINNKLDITPTLNFHGQLNITYTVSDSINATSSGQLVVTVLPINDAPLTQNDSYSLVEDTVLNVLAASPSGLLINDSDVDGDTLTVNTSPISNVSNGSLTLNSDGSFRYIPNSNFSGSDSFSYQVRDGKGGTAQGSVMLSINGINDIPVAINDIYSLDEDAILSILVNDANQLLSNDSDVDGDSLTVNTTPVSNVSNGSLTLNSNGSFSYTPSLNFNGTDSFTYQVSDSNGGIAQANVSLTIRAVNDLPVIGNAKQYSVDEDTNLNILATDSNHLLNDASDLDGDTLTVSLASNVNNGSLTLNSNGSFSYAPNLNFTGTDSFTYTVSDGNFVSGALNVTLTVNPINDIPVIGNAKSYNVDEDESLNVLATSNNHLLNDASDLDGDILTVSLVSNVANGNLALNSNGSFSYAPNLNFNGSDTFSYKVSDGDYVSDALTATLTVNPINDAPQITGVKSYSFDEDSSLNILVGDVDYLLIGTSDLDGDTLTVSLESNVSNGSLTLNSNGSFSYVPDNNFHGSDSFTYEVSDGNGGTAQGNVALTINAVNDIPVLLADSFSVNEDNVLTKLVGDVDQLLSNDNDADGDTLIVNTTPILNVSNGSLTLNSNGSFSYAPNLNFNGVDSFTYQVSDSNGGTAQAIVTLTINAVNDTPVPSADNYSTNEDITLTKLVGDVDQLLSNDNDVDGDSLTVNTTPISNVINGSLTLNSNGSFSYVPNNNYNGSDSFIYEVRDGNGGIAQGNVTLTINAVSDVPVAIADSYSVDEEDTLTILVGDANNLLRNDSDGDNDSLTVNTTPISNVTRGNLTLNNDGSFNYQPNADFSGIDSFIYEISDGNGGTAQATVTLTVNGINDFPIAQNDSYSFAEDFTWVRFVTDGDQLLSNDSDVDGDTLTVNTTPLIDVGNGILTLAADGSFSYTPNEDYTGTDSFTYEISDGNGGTAQASVALIVNPINDIPVAVDDIYTFNEDDILTKLAGDGDNLLGNDTDADADSLTVTLLSGVSTNGSLILNTDGSFSYTPDLNFNGTDSFTYQVNDSHGGIAQANVSLIISAVNDAPIAEDQSFSVDEDKTEADVVGSVIASDIESNTLAYSLTAGDTGLFNIDPSSGAISVKGTTPLDFETSAQHIVTVTITDDGSPIIASTDITVTININDVAGDELISEVASFGRPVIGSLELTGKKSQAQLTDSISDGNKLYFVGTVDNIDKDIYMVAYNKDSTLDASFGNGGSITFDFGQHEYARAITNNGSDYYVAFNSDNGTSTEVCFVKVNNSGAVDASFGTNGVSCTNEQKTLSINDIAYNNGNATLAAVGKVEGIEGVSDDDFLMIEMSLMGNFIDHTPADLLDSPHIIEDVSLASLDDEGIALYTPHNQEVVVTGNVLTSDGDTDVFAVIYDDGDAKDSFNGGDVKFYDVSGQGLNDTVKDIGGISETEHIAHLVGSTTLLSGAKDAFILTIEKNSDEVTTFGPNSNGIVIYDIDGDAGLNISSAEFNHVTTDGDNIYVSGTIFDLKSMPFITRVLANDGTVDSDNYGEVDGYRIFSYDSDNAFALSMSLDSDRTAWLPGYRESGGDTKMIISAVDVDGDVYDDEFEAGKKVISHSSLASDDSVSEIIQVKNGAQQDKFLVISTADDATDKHIILTRLTSDGLLDTTFDNDGHKQLKIGTSAIAKGVFELSTGKFIVYGDVTEAGVDNGFVARIDQNGLLDSNFASNGIYTTSAFGATNIHFGQVNLDSLDRLIAVGNYQNGSTSAFVLRLTALGALDTTFNALDTLGYIIGADTDDYSTVVIDGSNNIYVGGYRVSGDKDMLLVKYLVSGLLDNTFNSNTGTLTVDFFGADENVEYLAFDSDDSLYLVGNSLSTPSIVDIAKTSITGALDNSFSSDGKASYKMAALLDLTGEAGMSNAVIDSNDNIVVVGFNDVFLGNGKRHMIGRIKPDGALDSTFDTDGYFRDSTCPNESQLESITLLNNSSFIVAGQCYQNGIFKNNIQISHYLLD